MSSYVMTGNGRGWNKTAELTEPLQSGGRVAGEFFLGMRVGEQCAFRTRAAKSEFNSQLNELDAVRVDETPRDPRARHASEFRIGDVRIFVQHYDKAHARIVGCVAIATREA